jgi:hypothetical protein
MEIQLAYSKIQARGSKFKIQDSRQQRWAHSEAEIAQDLPHAASMARKRKGVV